MNQSQKLPFSFISSQNIQTPDIAFLHLLQVLYLFFTFSTDSKAILHQLGRAPFQSPFTKQLTQIAVDVITLCQRYIWLLGLKYSSEHCYRSLLQQLQMELPAKSESLQILHHYEEQLLVVLIRSAETFEAVSSLCCDSTFDSLLKWTVQIINSNKLLFLMLHAV